MDVAIYLCFTVVVYWLDDSVLSCFGILINNINKYKERNNRPSSINLKSLVHKHNKAVNKYHSQDSTDTRETPSVWIGGREEKTLPA